MLPQANGGASQVINVDACWRGEAGGSVLETDVWNLHARKMWKYRHFYDEWFGASMSSEIREEFVGRAANNSVAL